MAGDQPLSGRVILVTGASSGIGLAIARKAAECGAKIACCGRNAEKLREALVHLPGGGHEIHLFDSEDLAGVEAMVERVAGSMGKIGGVVHCAGMTAMFPLRDLQYDVAAKIFQINYFVFMALCKAACARGRYVPFETSIIGMSSMAAMSPLPSLSVYAASKAALNTSVVALARELSPKGVRINSICPNYVDTPMIEPIKSVMGADVFMEERVRKSMPLGLIKPEEVADAAFFLLSGDSGKITGTNMVISAGASY
jgi:NAD(P)-dependent dehydrogenase (short-subunit alcohol dehydrogenase family)